MESRRLDLKKDKRKGKDFSKFQVCALSQTSDTSRIADSSKFTAGSVWSGHDLRLCSLKIV